MVLFRFNYFFIENVMVCRLFFCFGILNILYVYENYEIFRYVYVDKFFWIVGIIGGNYFSLVFIFL